MRDIKERPTDRTPRVMDSAVRAPKELARRSLCPQRSRRRKQPPRSSTMNRQRNMPKAVWSARAKMLPDAPGRRSQTEESSLREKPTTPESSIRKPNSGERSKPVPLFVPRAILSGKAESVSGKLRKAPVGRSRLHSRPLSRAQKRLKQPQKARSRPRSAP